MWLAVGVSLWLALFLVCPHGEFLGDLLIATLLDLLPHGHLSLLLVFLFFLSPGTPGWETSLPISSA